MCRTNHIARTITLALLLTTITLLSWQVDAAKITTKTINASANNTNASQVELSHATTEAVVVVAPAAAATTIESKANDETDADIDADNEDAADTADTAAEDDDEDDDDVDDEEEGETASAAKKPAKSETALTAAEKNEDATASYSVWGMVRNVWNWIRDDLSESIFGDDDAEAAAGAQKALVREVRDVSHAAKAAVEGRTFGKIRRLQMMIIPLIFKFGILTAMVGFLIMLGMKTLFLVKLLVLMNAAAILAKFITLKANFGGHEHSAPQWNYQTWTPHSTGSWGASAPAASYSQSSEQHPSKEIHLHIHNGQVQQGYGAGGHAGGNGWESRSDPYGAYAPTPANEGDNELNNLGPIAMLPTKYPTNPVYGNQ